MTIILIEVFTFVEVMQHGSMHRSDKPDKFKPKFTQMEILCSFTQESHPSLLQCAGIASSVGGRMQDHSAFMGIEPSR